MPVMSGLPGIVQKMDAAGSDMNLEWNGGERSKARREEVAGKSRAREGPQAFISTRT